MTPVTLTRDQAHAAVAAAAAERDTIQANLLDLDGSFGKRLLAGATLTGQSRERWDAAAAGLSTLWDTFTAYSAVIDRAAEILAQPGRMSADRLSEASALLTGPSVRLAKAPAPLDERDLTAGPDLHLTLAATVQQMKREFTGLASEVSAAESVWNEVSDGLRQVADTLELARRQLPDLITTALTRTEPADVELADGLAQAEAGLRELRDLLNTDPLALWEQGRVNSGRLDRLKQQAAAIATRSAELASARAEADQRIAAASAAVGATRQAWQDATAARERAAARVLVPAQGPLPDVSELDGRLADLGVLHRAGRWTRMTSELDLLDKDAAAALRQCREAEQSATDLLGRRDELRGLLDAYRAKAGRTGGAEDAALTARYQQAHDLLWTAPCDLAAADAAVTGYQQAVLSLRRSGSRERA
ncbi:MAG TPA: hypothetical protein VHJ18_14890 [Streptosporangiaceae bacterium]|jgi:hypothetical protein|nr:hypothetical protein [Streptosporangiaceae bacterium]